MSTRARESTGSRVNEGWLMNIRGVSPSSPVCALVCASAPGDVAMLVFEGTGTSVSPGGGRNMICKTRRAVGWQGEDVESAIAMCGPNIPPTGDEYMQGVGLCSDRGVRVRRASVAWRPTVLCF